MLPLPVCVLGMPTAHAAVEVDDAARSGNPGFYRQLDSALATLDKSGDPHIRHLLAGLRAAPGRITIRQMTGDPSTWSSKGDPDHGHTNPDDGRPKNSYRGAPTSAATFVPLSAIQPGHDQWRNGVLVHELVHALDLATGHWNSDTSVRERRATFMQNLWRRHVGTPLRESYHGRFATQDYQHAARQGTITEYVDYILTQSDFPKPPGR
jgi:Effector protein